MAIVRGRATATVKHRSLHGRKLLICQPVDRHGESVSDPILAIDRHGAGAGDAVMLSSDGRGVQELLSDETTPVRWFTLGLIDPTPPPQGRGMREQT